MTEENRPESIGIMISNGVDERVVNNIGELVLNILNTRNDQETLREALKVVGTAVTPTTAPTTITGCSINMLNGEDVKPKNRARTRAKSK